MDAYPQAVPQRQDTPFSRMMFRHFGVGPNRDFITAEPVISAICQMAGLPQRDVLSRSRNPNLVAVRGRIALALRGLGMSYPAIGRALGRDHSTVMHAIRKAVRQ